MATPRKSTAKVSRFVQLQEQAAKKGKPRRADYVLGVDDGFDPEIRVEPLDIDQQEAFFYAHRAGDVFGALRIVLGSENYDRLKEVVKETEHPDELLPLILDDIIKHFNGKGAADVPGGSQA